MTDRLTPAMLRDLADLMKGAEIHYSNTGKGSDVYFRDEAARREAAKQRVENQDEIDSLLADAPPPPAKLRDECDCQEPLIRCDTFGMRCEICGKPERLNIDAPPPPAPFVTDHKWLDPECHASGCQTLILKAELEKLMDQRDKYIWQVRDTCARAEAAEADAKRLREALEFYANPEIYKPHPHGPAFDRRDLSGTARAALAGGNDG